MRKAEKSTFNDAMKAFCFFIFCCLAGTTLSQNEYDDIVEKKHLIETLERHQAEQLRQAEVRYQKKTNPSSSSSAYKAGKEFGYLLGFIAWALIIAVGAAVAYFLWLCMEALIQELIKRIKKWSGVKVHPELIRPAVPTPESLGIAAKKREAHAKRTLRILEAHPELIRPVVPTPESLGIAARKREAQVKMAFGPTRPWKPRIESSKEENSGSILEAHPELIRPAVPTPESVGIGVSQVTPTGFVKAKSKVRLKPF